MPNSLGRSLYDKVTKANACQTNDLTLLLHPVTLLKPLFYG